jgi:hypothetical protein
MPLSPALTKSRLIATMERTRKNPVLAYGIAIGAVAAATLLGAAEHSLHG